MTFVARARVHVFRQTETTYLVFYFHIGYAENSRNVLNSLLSMRLYLRLRSVYPSSSASIVERKRGNPSILLSCKCLVKFNTSFGLIFGLKTPHKIVVVKHGRTRHRDTNRGRKQPRYVSVGFGTFVFSTRVMFSVRRWGFVAPAREENRCKFMPRVFLFVSRSSFSYFRGGVRRRMRSNPRDSW